MNSKANPKMRDNSSENPWLEIPPEEYEKHMASSQVEQYQVLNMLFKKVLDTFQPSSLAVIGCSMGNGFEHIDGGITQKLVGIDINDRYLAIAAQRYAYISGMELICADITCDKIKTRKFDLIHAALLFEYVNIEKTLPVIVKLMKPHGVLSIGLQLPSPDSAPVTRTRYKSLEKLKEIMNLVDPEKFSTIAAKSGLLKFDSYELMLKKGKKLFVGYYRREA
jgi:ubiquinone/menaquinone biosynthesis C-methylase UbiE